MAFGVPPRRTKVLAITIMIMAVLVPPVLGLRQRLYLLPLVPLRRRGAGVPDADPHADRPLPGLRRLDGAHSRRQHVARAPVPAAADRGVHGAAGAGPLSHGSRAVPALAAGRRVGPVRHRGRRVLLRCLAHLPDVGRRRLVRHRGPAVPQGHRLLRLHAALAAPYPGLPGRRGAAQPARRAVHALPVRRRRAHPAGRRRGRARWAPGRPAPRRCTSRSCSAAWSW